LPKVNKKAHLSLGKIRYIIYSFCAVLTSKVIQGR